MYIAHLVLFPLSSIAPRTLQGYHMFRKAHYLCILHSSTASNNREIDNRCPLSLTALSGQLDLGNR